jgi:type II secretory pathway pseudopilin PulG
MSEKNLYENEDPSWQMHMQTLMKRKRNMEIAQIIDEAINEYYSLQGKPVPNWRYIKDVDWWIEYLKDLGIDPRNP